MYRTASSLPAGSRRLLSTARRLLLPLLLGAVATLATCALGWATPAAAGHLSAGREAVALRIALAQRGKPYVWGAAGPSAFDCSGLTSYAFHHAGFAAMPRTAAAQAAFVRRIPRSAMRPGDLVFFVRSGYVYHVGVYAGMSHGRRLILHAPYPGQHVHIEPIWTDAWFPGTLRHG